MSKTQPIPRSVDNSADYFAELQKSWQQLYEDTSQMLYDSAMTDGHPPMTEPNSEVGMWQSLSMMRATGDPRYWQDPAAQAMYTKLGAKFGQAHPPMPAEPTGAMPPVPT